MIALVGVFGGVVLAILAALNWRREDTGKVVVQQAQVFEDLKGLNAELRLELDRVRSRRDVLVTELDQIEREMEKEHADREALMVTCREHETALRDALMRIEELQQELIEGLEKENGHG